MLHLFIEFVHLQPPTVYTIIIIICIIAVDFFIFLSFFYFCNFVHHQMIYFTSKVKWL